MKPITAIAVLIAGTLPFVAWQSSRTADEIAMEASFNEALLRGDWKKLIEIEADDLIFTEADGSVTHKADEVGDLKSGDLKFDSIDMSEVKVQNFGVVVVITGKLVEKVQYKDADLSGTYRFTDVWATRDGKWQLVAGQETLVGPKK